jgi:hypothetical protein
MTDQSYGSGTPISAGPATTASTINASSAPGATKEAKITSAIGAAAGAGSAFVFIPATMLPFNAALVVFNNAVRLIREGSNPAQYDIRAYGAAGDNATNDTIAIQACLTAARAGQNGNSIRNIVYIPAGTYLFANTLDVSDLSLMGDGQVASALRAINGFGAITPLVKVNGGQATYSNFSIDGNRANNGGQLQTGVQIVGGAFWTTWINVYIHDTTGYGMQTSLFGGLRPFQHQFINLTIRQCDRIGLRIDAGRHLGFYNLDVEFCGLLAAGQALVAITGSDETASRIIIDNIWLEKVGTNVASADALEIDAGDKITIRKGNIQDYGLAAGGGGSGINIIGGTNIEIDGVDFAGRAASQAGQRKIKIAAGVTGTVLRNMSGLSSAGAAMDVEDLSTVGAAWVGQRNSSSTIRPSEAVLVSGVDVSAGDIIIPVALTAARLVGVPLNPVQGQRIQFVIIQGGAGAFAVTWNAIFKKTWSDAGNAAGARSSIAFVYDGTNWNQDGAQAPYV